MQQIRYELVWGKDIEKIDSVLPLRQVYEKNLTRCYISESGDSFIRAVSTCEITTVSNWLRVTILNRSTP